MSSLEGWLRRGVVSSEAASELMPKETNATTTRLYLLQRQYVSKDRLALLVLVFVTVLVCE